MLHVRLKSNNFSSHSDNLAEALPFVDQGECERSCSAGASCRYYKYIKEGPSSPRWGIQWWLPLKGKVTIVVVCFKQIQHVLPDARLRPTRTQGEPGVQVQQGKLPWPLPLRGHQGRLRKIVAKSWFFKHFLRFLLLCARKFRCEKTAECYFYTWMPMDYERAPLNCYLFRWGGIFPLRKIIAASKCFSSELKWAEPAMEMLSTSSWDWWQAASTPGTSPTTRWRRTHE